jgi:PAS domain S-box-containing protein
MAQADLPQRPSSADPIYNLSRPILRACGLITLVISALGLIGWFGNIAPLKTVLPGLPAMKPNCAIGLALAAGTLVMASQTDWIRLRGPAIAMSLFVGLIGVFALFQLAADMPAIEASRLSLASALSLLLLGIAGACVAVPRSWTRLIVWTCSLLGLLIAFFGMFFTSLAILYDPGSLYETGRLASIALHAGAGFFILFCGLLVWGCRDSLRLPLVALGVLVLAPLAAVMVYFALAERRAALDAGRDRVADHAHLLALDMGNVIADARALLELIASARGLAGGDRTNPSSNVAPPDCERFLNILLPIHPWVRELRVSEPDGNAICSSNPSSGNIGIGDRGYFAEAIRERSFSLSGLLISRASRQPRLFAALPLKDGEVVVGVASIAIDLSVFGGIIGHVGLEPGETALVLSRAGIVFANRPVPPDLTGTRLADAAIVKRASSVRSGQSTEPDWSGRARLFAFRPIADTGAVVLVGLDKQTLTDAIDRTLRDRLLLLTLIMTTTAIASLLGGELLIFGPIRRLARRASLMERGDFGEPLRVTGIGEIWTLYNAFVRMRDAIADRESRLSDALVRQQAVFESAIDGIITINESGSIESLNPAAERLFGYKAADLLHRHIMMLLPTGDGEETHPIRDLRRALHGLGQVREITAQRADGSTFPADVALSEMGFRRRRVIVAIVRDASERKRIERLKDEFVSTVSHELRTPLTSIAGSLGLLSGGAAGQLPETVRRLISIAHRNSLRLIRLINEILDLEKIEAGKLTFVRSSIAMPELTAEAIEANHAFAQEYGVNVLLKAEDSTPSVLGDRDRLMQVLTNLLSNAIKFSPRGGNVRVGVGAQQNMVRLTVADDGPGIPAEFRPRMFTKFAQADTSDGRNRGGTGLGLAVAKEIVELHGGTLTFDSEIGRGTAFHVDLPAQSSAAFAGRVPVRQSEKSS